MIEWQLTRGRKGTGWLGVGSQKGFVKWALIGEEVFWNALFRLVLSRILGLGSRLNGFGMTKLINVLARVQPVGSWVDTFDPYIHIYLLLFLNFFIPNL